MTFNICIQYKVAFKHRCPSSFVPTRAQWPKVFELCARTVPEQCITNPGKGTGESEWLRIGMRVLPRFFHMPVPPSVGPEQFQIPPSLYLLHSSTITRTHPMSSTKTCSLVSGFDSEISENGVLPTLQPYLHTVLDLFVYMCK